MYVSFAKSFIKMIDINVARKLATCWLNKAGNSHSSCWGQLKLACSLGQVRDVSGLVGFSCKLGWPQQLFFTHETKTGNDILQGTGTRTSALIACWGHPQVRHWCTHTEDPAWTVDQETFTSHFSYKISLHRTLQDKKWMQWGKRADRQMEKKWQVSVLQNSQNMRGKAYPKSNQIAFGEKSCFY